MGECLCHRGYHELGGRHDMLDAHLGEEGTDQGNEAEEGRSCGRSRRGVGVLGSIGGSGGGEGLVACRVARVTSGSVEILTHLTRGKLT